MATRKHSNSERGNIMLYSWDTVRELVAKYVGNIALYGPPSCSKSDAFLNHLDPSPIAVQATEGMLAVEFFIGKMPRDGSMVNVPGPAAIAARDSLPFLVQEIDRFSDECKSVVGMLADNPKTRRITYAGDDDQMHEFRPSEEFRVLATSNFGPERIGNEALASRFLWVLIDEPCPEALADLPEELREAARVLAGHPEPSQRVSFRAFKRYVELQDSGFDIDTSAQLVFGHRWQDFADGQALAALTDQAYVAHKKAANEYVR